jgi:hypothetical protein
MKVTKRQLKEIIKENLLLELNVAWFAARKGSSLLSFLSHFLADDENGMIEAAKDIANYYDGDCGEMMSDIQQISNNTSMINALMKVGVPMVKQLDLKDKSLTPELIDKIMTQEVVGCDDKVINAIKKLAFKFADKLLTDYPEFNNYQMAKDLPKLKKSYNVT